MKDPIIPNLPNITVTQEDARPLAHALRQLADLLDQGEFEFESGGLTLDLPTDALGASRATIRGDLTLRRTTATLSPMEQPDGQRETDPLSKLASQPNDTLFMRAVSKYTLKDGRVLYHGDNPVTFVNTPKGQAVLKSRPWVIDHPDLHGKLWRVKAIECHCTFRIQAGRPIGVIVEPWE